MREARLRLANGVALRCHADDLRIYMLRPRGMTVAGEVVYPSHGLFYFKVADPLLMSAIFRAYNDWLADPRNARRAAAGFCRTDPARLKGIAMLDLDDVEDRTQELERAARLGLSGAMITEHRLEDRR